MAEPRWRGEIPLMGASILIAFIIWIMAKQGALQTDQVAIPVVVENSAANVRIESEPKTVPAVIKFPQNLRSRVVAQNFEARINLQEVFGADPRKWAGIDKTKSDDVEINLDHIHTLDLPQSVRVVELLRRSVKVQSQMWTLEVPVFVEMTGAPPANYELGGEPRVEPSRILVTAPPDALKRLGEPGAALATTPVRLEGRREDFIDYATLRTLPPGVRLVDENQSKIQVFASIREREEERVLAKVPVRLYVFNEDLRAGIEPREVEVRVRGKISALDLFDPSMVAFAPGRALPEEPGEHDGVELRATISEEAPEAVRASVAILSVEPRTVGVKFFSAGESPEPKRKATDAEGKAPEGGEGTAKEPPGEPAAKEPEKAPAKKSGKKK